MELTDTRPAPSPAAPEFAERPPGVSGFLGTGDHKSLGRLLIALSILVVAAAEVLQVILRFDVSNTKTHQLLSAERYVSLVTLQPTGVVLIGLIPLLLGIALVVVPLQIGSRSVAFPRAAAAAVWGYLLSGGLLIASYFASGGPGGSRASAVDLWALSTALLAASIVLLSVVLVTTVFTQRAPGLSMTRIPLFSWSIVVAGILWVFTMPVLIGLLLLAWVDHSHGAIFSGAGGIEVFGQVAWVLHQPQIYALCIPALGIIGDVVTTFSRARDEFRRSISMVLIGFFGVMSFGAFTLTSYATFPPGTVAQTPFDNPVVIVMSLLVVLPVLGMLGQVGDSMRRGRSIGKPLRGSPLPAAMVALVLLLLGTLVGVLEPIKRFDLHGTLYTDAQFQLVVGAAIAAAIAGLFHWSSKIAGSQGPDVLGLGAAGLTLLGTLAIAAGDIASVIGGTDAKHVNGTQTLNLLAFLGAAAVAGAVLLAAVALLLAARNARGTATEPDAWGAGQTLEWATASPPSYEDFEVIPEVRSEAPLLDLVSTSQEVAS